MKCKKALQKLKDGNKRFVKSAQINHTVGAKNNSKLVFSQKPYAVVLTCSDSRVGVNTIFDAKLGDLFIIKNAGNIVDKSTLASIEFAIAKLNVKLIMVLSHQNCGAVKFAKTHPVIKNEKREENFNFLLRQIRTVITDNKDFSTKELTQENANHSVESILEDSLIISEKVAEKTLKIVTGYYKISTGKVVFL